jgi:hypothetical protein
MTTAKVAIDWADAQPADLNKSANSIIKLAEANGYTAHAHTYNHAALDRYGAQKDATTRVLAVTLTDNTDLNITVIWRDGRFAYARPSNDKQMLFGHMNHNQLKAAITGDWQKLPRCPSCRRWNAPCHCQDEDA